MSDGPSTKFQNTGDPISGIVEERHLFVSARCHEQIFVGTKKLIVDHYSKPPFCGVELF